MEDLKALNMLAMVIALSIALVGMLSHYLKKWLRGETQDTLFEYVLGKGAWKSTAQAAIAVFTTVISMLLADQIDMSTTQGLIIAFTIGYAGNSAFNKDSQLIDTQSQVK